MIELVDEHLGSGIVLPVLRKIDERHELLHHGAALVADRADEDRRPELAAVLPLIVYLGLAAAIAAKSSVRRRQAFRADPYGQKRIEAFGEHLVPLVSGQSQKSIIRENNGMHRCRIGEDHRHARLLGSHDERAEFPAERFHLCFGLFLSV